MSRIKTLGAVVSMHSSPQASRAMSVSPFAPSLQSLEQSPVSNICWLCSFQMTFVEPMSHTILNGIGKDFLELIFDTTNGIVVDGRPFHVPLDVQHDMDIVIDSLDLPSAFNRPPCQIRGCALSCACKVMSVLCSVAPPSLIHGHQAADAFAGKEVSRCPNGCLRRH